MSSGDQPSGRKSPPQKGKSPSRRGASPARKGRSPARGGSSTPNVIEFIDSQDPNVKSAIQRHTAYHSAAQRREARLKSLRRGNTSRFLEWGRRTPTAEPSQPATLPSSRSRSLSVSPVKSLGGSERTVLSPRGVSADITTQSSPELPSTASFSSQNVVLPLYPWTPADESILQYYMMHMCRHVPSQAAYDEVMCFIRSDDACTYLLLAYCYAMRSRILANVEADQDRRNAQQYFGRGTNILWNRLRNPVNASSDVNIQAVLLLVSYTSDYGHTNEVEIHAEALRTMIAQRGGVNSVMSNPALHRQLLALETSRQGHMTLSCDQLCPSPFRFPQGFWPKQH